jgi:transketolase
VVVEAATPFGWADLAGDDGEIVGVDHYGASAPGDVMLEQYGFTPDRVVAAAHASLQHAGA